MAMISSQPWQFIIGLSLGALLIGGISSLQILEKSTKEDKNKPNQDRYGSNRGSFGNMFSSNTNRGSFGDMFKYTTAARPYGQTRSSFGNMFSYSNPSRPVTRSRTNPSSIFGQNRNLDYNYRGTRSVNRNQGVFYNM